MQKDFTHEPDAHRYVLRVDGELTAVVDYTINGNAISFTRTYTSPGKRGRGHAAEIVAFAADDVEANTGMRIVPMCWYVAQWFDKHSERAALLTR
ncbi:GNAT family N-acetyltransferase [Parafrigoribacterium soli]|uniref:GNAT family N-acetyltransferase n=1 Tax=Parafrigoribacterium soli TaxID=3144663 RepID=UPI0032EEF23B